MTNELPQTISNILLIDDHPFFLNGLKLGLESLPNSSITVDVLSNANAAIARIDELTSYDLILCDLNLPDLDGLGFLESLIERECFVRVAIISASELEADVQKAMSMGAAGFINKGLEIELFKEALISILNGHRYIPERLITTPKPVLKGLSSIDNLGITERQYEVLKRLSDGMSNKEISELLSIKETTVKSHLQVLFQVLNVTNRTACIVKARAIGLVHEEPQQMELVERALL